MFKNIFLFLLLGSLLSCNPNKWKVTLENIDNPSILNGRTIPLSSNVLMPLKIFNIRDNIIIMDYTKDDIFKVFRLPEFKYVFSWGKIGRGPGEFNFIDPSTIIVNGDKFEFLDLQKIKTFQLKAENIFEIDELLIPTIGAPVNGLKKINDSIYIADIPMINDYDYEHIIINTKTKKIIKYFGKFSNDGLEIKNISDNQRAYHKSSVLSMQEEKYVAFYTYFNRLRIYNTNGKLLKEVNIRSNGDKPFSLNETKSNIVYNAEPLSTQKYIYVLNINKSVYEVENNSTSYNPKLNIWDWNGSLVGQFILDKPITSFLIEEHTRKLYGISYMNMNEVYEFNLPDSLFSSSNIHFFNQIENDFYKSKMFKEWRSTSMEEDKNKTTLTNDLVFNSRIFYNPKIEDASIWINVISKADNTELPAGYYFNKYCEPQSCAQKNYLLDLDTLHQKKMFFYSYEIESNDPIGQKYFNKSANWIWQEKNRVYEIKFYAYKNYQKLLAGVEEIVNSTYSK